MNIRITSQYVILCDLDGTLVETDYANYLSYKRAIEDVSDQTAEIQYNSEERFNRGLLKKQLPYLTEDQFKEIVALKTDFYSEYLSETKVNSALAEIIINHSGTNDIFLVTGCRERRVVETLKYHNLLDFFSNLLCREELSVLDTSNKYANALSILNVNPVNTIVFENSAVQIKKAIIAGVLNENIFQL